MLRKALIETSKRKPVPVSTTIVARGDARGTQRSYDSWGAISAKKRKLHEKRRTSAQRAVAVVDLMERSLGRKAPIIQDLSRGVDPEESILSSSSNISSSSALLETSVGDQGSWEHAIRYFHNAVTSGSPLLPDHSFRVSALFAGLAPSSSSGGSPTSSWDAAQGGGIEAPLPPLQDASPGEGSALSGLPLQPLLSAEGVATTTKVKSETFIRQERELNNKDDDKHWGQHDLASFHPNPTRNAREEESRERQQSFGPSVSEQLLRWWLLFRSENLPATPIEIYALMKHGWMRPALMSATRMGGHDGKALTSSSGWNHPLTQELVAQYVAKGQWQDGLKLLLQSPVVSRPNVLESGSSQEGSPDQSIGVRAKTIASSEYVPSLPSLISEGSSESGPLASFIPRKDAVHPETLDGSDALEGRGELPVGVVNTIQRFQASRQWAAATILFRVHGQQGHHSDQDDATALPVGSPDEVALSTTPGSSSSSRSSVLASLAIAMAKRLEDQQAFSLLRVFLCLSVQQRGVSSSAWAASLQVLSEHLQWRHGALNPRLKPPQSTSTGTPCAQVIKATTPSLLWKVCWILLQLPGSSRTHRILSLHLATAILEQHGPQSLPPLLRQEMARISLSAAAGSQRAPTPHYQQPEYYIVLLRKVLLKCREQLPSQTRRKLAVAWDSQREWRDAVAMGGDSFALEGEPRPETATCPLSSSTLPSSSKVRLGEVGHQPSVKAMAGRLQKAVEQGDISTASVLAGKLTAQQARDRERYWTEFRERGTRKKKGGDKKEETNSSPRAPLAFPRAQLTVTQLDALAQAQVSAGSWEDATKTVATLRQLATTHRKRQQEGRKCHYSVLEIALLDSVSSSTGNSWRHGLKFYQYQQYSK